MQTNQSFDQKDFRKSCDHQHHHHNPLKRVILALFLITGGTLAILGKTNLIPENIYEIIFSWQMLLIAIGIYQLAGKSNSISGFILIAVGGVFLIPEFFETTISNQQLVWPAVLIAVGLIILFRGNKHWHKDVQMAFKKGDINDKDYLNDNHVFGGGDFIVTSDNFKGGKVSSLFGGGKYDFRKCKLHESQENVLEVSMIFGGIELIVPADWNIKVEVDAIFGGFSNKKSEYMATNIDYSRQLIIRGSAIFGGGEIKRF